MADFLTPSEFAEATAVDTATVRRWLRARHIKGQRVGPRGHWKIPPSEIRKVRGEGRDATLTTAQADQCFEDIMRQIAADEQAARQNGPPH